MRRSLVSPVVVGRDAEPAALGAALDSAVAGVPAVVLVGGEAGVGKTRLVEEAGARAREAGARILIGSCIELGGAGLPLGPLSDALRALAHVTPPGELDAFLGPAWADRSTLDLVALLVHARRRPRPRRRRRRQLPLGRAAARAPVRTLVTSWERVRSVRHIELDRFGPEEVAGQLEAILGERPTRRMLDLVDERSEGNAFLVEEVLSAVQGGADPDRLPSTLRDVLLARADHRPGAAPRPAPAA